MCMMFGFFNPAIRKSADRTRLLRHLARKSQAGGDKSFGLAYIKEGKAALARFTGPASTWLEQNGKDLERIASSAALIGHCRWPTQGEVTRLNTHPFPIGDWLVGHNGQIRNSKALHARASFVARGTTDSEEALSYIVGKAFSAESLGEIEGYYAFEALRKDGGELLLICDDHARLHLAKVGAGYVWATDADVLASSLQAIGVEAQPIRIQSQLLRLSTGECTPLQMKSEPAWSIDSVSHRSLFGKDR